MIREVRDHEAGTEETEVIELNDNAIEYMNKLGFRDVVLDAIRYTT